MLRRVRTALRHYLVDTDSYDTAVFLQLELKGLARIGDDIDRLLQRSLYGYDPLEQ